MSIKDGNILRYTNADGKVMNNMWFVARNESLTNLNVSWK